MEGTSWRTKAGVAVLCGIGGGIAGGALVSTGLKVGNLAEWGAAIGTVGALLIATRTLRHQTDEFQAAEHERSTMLRHAADQLAAAQEQARVSREAFTASIRPLLVDAPQGGAQPTPEKVVFQGMANPITVEQRGTILWLPPVGAPPSDQTIVGLSIPITNIGAGAALLQGIGLGAQSLEGGWSGHTSRAVVATDEDCRFTFTLPGDRADLSNLRDAVLRREDLIVSVTYTNASGRDQLRSEFHLHDGRIRQVFLYEGQSDTPFASTAPAGDA